MMQIQCLLGLFVFTSCAFFLSSHKKDVCWPIVARGLLLQAVMALGILGLPLWGWDSPVQKTFPLINRAIAAFLGFADVGSEFLFSDLALFEKSGFVLAFQVLPLIVFISSLMAVLYHLGVMQWVVKGLATVMQKVMRVSGAETLAAAANVFVGQNEAPLVVKPFLSRFTSSELFSLMTGGMATVSGSVLGAYVFLLKDHLPGIGGHLLAASLLSAPAALVIAKIIIPETEKPETLGQLPKQDEKAYVNVIEAAAAGASEGVQIALSVGGMLIAFIALIAMLDAALQASGELIGFAQWGQDWVPQFLKTKNFISGDVAGAVSATETMNEGARTTPLSLSLIFSWLFMPIAFLLGVPWTDMPFASYLIGEKVVFNEFLAYTSLTQQAQNLRPRTLLIMSYALCGFANFSSIAIQIGGIGSLVPKRRAELASFGLRAVAGGTLAAFLTACWAGLLSP